MRSIRIAVIGFALAGWWCMASDLRAAIIKVEYDFSSYPAVPFALNGEVHRLYEDLTNPGPTFLLAYPATITASGMQAQLQFPSYPYGPSSNPEAYLHGSFYAGVVCFQIVWSSILRLTNAPTLEQQTGSSWTLAEVTPLLDFTGTNHFAAEGHYIKSFSVYETSAGYGLTGIKLYIDTSVNVPERPSQVAWFALLGVLVLACWRRH